MITRRRGKNFFCVFRDPKQIRVFYIKIFLLRKRLKKYAIPVLYLENTRDYYPGTKRILGENIPVVCLGEYTEIF